MGRWRLPHHWIGSAPEFSEHLTTKIALPLTWPSYGGCWHMVGKAQLAERLGPMAQLFRPSNGAQTDLSTSLPRALRVNIGSRRFIETAAEALEYSLAKLGAVTHAANHFKLAMVLGDGTTTHTTIGDSSGTQPRGAGRQSGLKRCNAKSHIPSYEITYNIATGRPTLLGGFAQHCPSGSVPRIGWRALQRLNTTLPRWLNTTLPRCHELEGALPGGVTQQYLRVTKRSQKGFVPVAHNTSDT